MRDEVGKNGIFNQISGRVSKKLKILKISKIFSPKSGGKNRKKKWNFQSNFWTSDEKKTKKRSINIENVWIFPSKTETKKEVISFLLVQLNIFFQLIFLLNFQSCKFRNFRIPLPNGTRDPPLDSSGENAFFRNNIETTQRN